MKKTILDTPFHDSFSDFLVKGETIIWSGQPKRNYSLDGFEIAILILLLFSLIISWRTSIGFAFFIGINIFFAWLIFTSKSRDVKEGENTIYAISQKRLFYKFNNRNTSKVFFIPFENIKNISIKHKDIYIKTKRTEKVPFDLFDLDAPMKRRQHLLRDLDEFEFVAQLIEENMNKNKK
ncbi:MAG: hypothetical protein AB8H03_21765 [Saprospiraceae bacterium]